MKKLSLLTLVLALGAGCIESSTLLTVNPDGSGTITVREYFSPQVTGMMQGMGDAVQDLGEGVQTALGVDEQVEPMPDTSDLSALFEESIQAKAEGFGHEVQLISSESRQNKSGWQGYQATYSFPDINNVTLLIGQDAGGAQDGGTGMEMDQGPGNTSYRFEFEPGDVATLKVVPVPAETGDDDEPGDEDETGDAEALEGMSGMGEMGGQMMAQMMGPMLKGMRLGLFVRVNGEVVESDAEYPSPKHPNVFTIMDLPMDAVLTNPKAMGLLAGDKGDSVSDLKALNLPGVKLEEDDQPITIKFK